MKYQSIILNIKKRIATQKSDLVVYYFATLEDLQTFMPDLRGLDYTQNIIALLDKFHHRETGIESDNLAGWSNLPIDLVNKGTSKTILGFGPLEMKRVVCLLNNS